MRRITALAGTAGLALAGGFIPAAAHAATIPGGGAHIVFARAGNIWVANANGSGLKQVTKTGSDSQPVIRGTTIAFTRGGNIWTMTSTGASQQKWMAGHGASFAPGNTNNISFITNDTDKFGCYVQEVVTQALTIGSQPSVLATAEPGCDGSASEDSLGPTTAWTNSGVAYSVSHTGCCDNQADPDSVAIFITNGTRYPYGIAWDYQWGAAPAVATNGSQIAFSSSLPTQHKQVHVYTIPANVRGNKVTQVSTDKGVQTPTYSPDGKFMLWTQNGVLREYGFATGKTVTLIKNGGLSPSWG